ncbi:adenine phosphoribosyltransferase [Lojkania enalia]|uniref:adenine phosphoribosyltransferase n=1 Tax=Lojkania enalia TaxID=147567 RepID=A0A9P4K3H1_9PLEO|nr:adenine phosphoribosyltransferase [Didymosphaeria enalia]
MSAQPISSAPQPHDPDFTAAHPPASKPDPTLESNASQRRLSATSAAAAAELSRLTVRLQQATRQFPDFPSPGILFEDILPIFASPALHEALVRALELHISQSHQKPDVIVGLEARGFLFGPSLALRLGAAFVPVRKKGKLPGPCETAGYQKEYGEDFFQIQSDGIKPGQKVLVVDDIIATGGSAAAAGSLVKKLGGTLLGYVFLMELDFLKGRAKLDAPVYTLLSSQEK